MIICKQCKKEKEEKDFYKLKENSNGLRGKCKDCFKNQNLSWNKSNHPKMAKATQTFRSNPLNKEKILATRKSYFERHPNYKKEYYRKNVEYYVRKRLEYKYNMTLEELNLLTEKQAKKCAICKEEKKLIVDHCHSKKHVRGLLCFSCNTLLGQAKDNIK